MKKINIWNTTDTANKTLHNAYFGGYKNQPLFKSDMNKYELKAFQDVLHFPRWQLAFQVKRCETGTNKLLESNEFKTDTDLAKTYNENHNFRRIINCKSK